jgi:hypothetical protein
MRRFALQQDFNKFQQDFNKFQQDGTGGGKPLFSYKLARRGVKHGERSFSHDRIKGEYIMAGIFTRKAIADILNNEDLTPEDRTAQLFSLYGRALDDGYISKSAAQAAQEAAVKTAQEAWAKEQKPVDIKETPEYKELFGQFEGYKTKQTARTSAEYADVKPKFFDRVYDLVDRADGAKPVAEQLAALRKDYEEYFVAADPNPNKPQFGAKPEGGMPKGEEGAVAAFSNAWGFTPKK